MKQAIAVLALIGGAVGLGAGVAQAGIPGDTVAIELEVLGGEDPVAAADALTIELFEEDGTDITSLCSQGAAVASPDGAIVRSTCSSISEGLLTVGASGLGEYVHVGTRCVVADNIVADDVVADQAAVGKPFEDTNATFRHTAGQTHTCSSVVAPPPPLIVDVGVAGGPAVPSDFEIEVYANPGDGSILATLTDPSGTDCDPLAPSEADCDSVALDVGLYQLGSTEVAGYQVSSTTCNNVNPPTNDEVTKPFGGIGGFGHGDFARITYCKIIMEFITQTVSADIDVINDNGGAATGADFTIEIFDSTDTIVASGIDPEPGSGNASFEAELPIGDYTFGIDGPEGYEISVVATPFDPNPVAVKEIDDPAAQFTLTRNQAITAVITADDVADTPATTVPETTMPPADTTPPVTTAPPAPPATPVPVNVLPATGNTSSTLVAFAIAMLLMGSGAVFAARRS